MLFIIHAITIAAIASCVRCSYFNLYGNNYYPSPFYQYQQQGTYDCPSGALCSRPCPYENTPVKVLFDINTPNYLFPTQFNRTQAVVTDVATHNKQPTANVVLKVRLGRYWRDVLTFPLCKLIPNGQCNLLANIAQCMPAPQFGADKFICLAPNMVAPIPSPSITLRPGLYDVRVYAYSSAGEVLSCSQADRVPVRPNY